jgi:glycogen debranching enzyme
LVIGFGSTIDEASAAVERAGTRAVRMLRRRDRAEQHVRAGVSTGEDSVDTAYAQILSRFDQCLVARDMRVHAGREQPDSTISAIFAGDKYFLDPWKRDENISLGALLATGDFQTARAILDDTWQYQDPRTGRLPQIIRLGEALVYYSSDGTLWALRRLHGYTRKSGDTSLLEAKYPLVEHFFTASLVFVQRGLLPSGGIVDPAYLWETWMDTPYTPRDGYPVEIELLWLTNLASYAPLIAERNPELGRRLQETLAEGRETFRSFYLDGYLADSLAYDWQPRTALTPNGYMAFGLEYPLPDELARGMVALGRKQLAGRVGIRSLAPRDWAAVLSPEFMADPRNFDGPNMASVGIYNYHRGVEWLWLNQFFVRGELLYGDPDHAYDRYLSGQVHAALHSGGVGGLSELHDIHGPLGADFQAWSMAGFVESLHAFGGVDADAAAGVVTVCPTLPRRWNGLRWTVRIGECRLALRYEREADGATMLNVEPQDRETAGLTLRAGLPAGDDARAQDVRVNGREAESKQSSDGRVWVQTRPAGPTSIRVN